MGAWYCRSCDASVGDEAVIRRAEGRAHMLVFRCPTCQGLVEPDRPRPVGSYPHALLGALRYPLKPVAAVHLGGLGALAAVLAFVPMIGRLIAGGLQIAYLAQTVRLGAMGREELADLEPEGDLWAYVRLFYRQFLAVVVPFAPLIAHWYIADDQGLGVMRVALAALGLCYLPASILCVAHSDSLLGAFNFVGGSRLIARIPGPYALTTLALGLVAGTHVASMTLVAIIVSPLGGLPLIPAALQAALGLIFPVIGARMLGLLVFQHQTELGLEE